MNALMTAIVLWLGANFGLPENYEHPGIEFVAADRLAAERSRALPGKPADAHGGLARQLVAFYDDHSRAIYLPAGWTGSSPVELSVLVHEMVHHLQNLDGRSFACPGQREKLAYEAQDRWLGLFGQDLASAFNIDRLTLLVTTACLH